MKLDGKLLPSNVGICKTKYQLTSQILKESVGKVLKRLNKMNFYIKWRALFNKDVDVFVQPW